MLLIIYFPNVGPVVVLGERLLYRCLAKCGFPVNGFDSKVAISLLFQLLHTKWLQLMYESRYFIMATASALCQW